VEKSAEPSIHKQCSPTQRKKSVLIIDDGADLLEVQKDFLEIEGFEVFTAQSGTEAFKVLNEINKPDLILLDVQMDEMSGPDFLRMLEEKKPEIVNSVPVVFLSGMEDMPQGRVVGFIRKPFDIDKYLEDVHQFIDLGPHSPLNY